MTDIQHKESDHRGILFIKDNENTVAELTYSLTDNVMTIDHTEVDRSLEGQGIGTKLTNRAVEIAREKDRKINPLCPFAEVLFDRNEQWGDLRVG